MKKEKPIQYGTNQSMASSRSVKIGSAHPTGWPWVGLQYIHILPSALLELEMYSACILDCQLTSQSHVAGTNRWAKLGFRKTNSWRVQRGAVE